MLNKYQLPIKELFKILEIDSSDLEKIITVPHLIKIQGPQGFVNVNAFVKKRHQTARYTLENNEEISCSINHIVFENGIPTLIKSCATVDTLYDTLAIIGITDLGVHDVYDVALDYPHQYITPNGIIHHNTTLAKVLLNELDIEELDILEINASRTNSVEDIRDKVINFIQMIPFGPFKVVLLDEADYLSLNAQAVLRGVMETYASTSRFILTCNYPNKIIPALHSRCQGFHIEKTDQTEFTARVATILVNENIEFDLDTLDTYVKITYPDLRKCINMLQQNSTDGRLINPAAGDTGQADYKIEMVALFKAGKIREARKLLCGRARPEEMEEIYTWLYQNIDLFGEDDDTKDAALLIIKQGLVDHTICADSEICLAATLVKLGRLKTQ